MRRTVRVFPILLVASLSSFSVADVIYVDHSATDPVQDGSTWCRAFVHLQDGLSVAQHGDEVRVAHGFHRPDRGAGQTLGDRTSSFRVPDGVRVLGGYAGCGTPDPDFRHPLSGPILIGDLALDDGPNFTNRSDNAYHVVTIENAGPGTVLERFSIQGGHADGIVFPHSDGGGIYIRGGAPTISDVFLNGNWANFNGGGIHERDSTTVILDCFFLSNKASSGGGLFVGGNATILDSVFAQNNASDGGGVYVNTEATAAIADSIFANNTANASGGAVVAALLSNVTMDRCGVGGNSAIIGGGLSLHGDAKVSNTLIVGNEASYRGGGIEFGSLKTGFQEAVNCTIVGNTVVSGDPGSGGGGILFFNFGIRQSIRDSILWGNSAGGDASKFAQLSGDFEMPIMEHNCIQGWPSLDSAGNFGDDPRFVYPIYDYTNVTTPPDFRLRPDSPAIDAGTLDSPSPAGPRDLDGHARILCGRVDMGAYEFGIGDVNCDRSVDLEDFAEWSFCATGPDGDQLPAGCEALDFDDNMDVSLRDFAAFQQAFFPWP